MQDYSTLIIFVLMVFGVSIAVSLYNFFKRRKEIRTKILESWGKISEEKYKTDDLDSISSYYLNKKSFTENKFLIDDITWNDLDMEKLFIRLNNTHSSVGEEYLYNMLREPAFDESALKERGRVIDLFQKNINDRQKLQYLLELLGKQRHTNISKFMTDFSYMELKYAFVYKLLAFMPIASIALCFVSLNTGFFIVLISFITNLLVHYKMKNKIEMQLFSISYAAQLVSTAGKILRADIEGIDEYRKSIRESFDKLKSIGRKVYHLANTSGDVFAEYAKITFLIELRSYDKILGVLENNREHFRKLYETIGFLDSMISVASYRDSLQYYAEPDFIQFQDGIKNEVHAKKLYHPLIKDPVPNSINLDGSILVTGSNASGKSTFLKTLAINSIFAQTIFTCLAGEYRSGIFFTMTSMALRDSIANNESYFIAEIKSLKRIFNMINNEVPCICFIDEILRGTNTIERIAASSRVLMHLSGKNCICLAATHDIELTSILEGIYDNYHFREEITDNDVVFDYKLYEGKAKSRNALKLLKLMGFNNTIVEDAEKAAFDFEHSGMWSSVQEKGDA